MTGTSFFEDPEIREARAEPSPPHTHTYMSSLYEQLDYWATEARTTYAEEDYPAATVAAIMFLAFVMKTRT